MGECRSTRLFIISNPWVAWTNELFQPNNSAIRGRYWMQLQHKIIHSRQQRGEIQLGFHLHYENEKQSLPCQGTLHSYDLAAFIATPCQINLCLVQHKNDINHTLVPDSGKSIDSVFPCILYVILTQKTSQNKSYIKTVYITWGKWAVHVKLITKKVIRSTVSISLTFNGPSQDACQVCTSELSYVLLVYVSVQQSFRPAVLKRLKFP